MLTPPQKQIFDYIQKYKRKNGYSPSLPEIARHFRRSVSTIHQHVKALESGGYLEREPHRRRSMEIPKTEKMVRIPLLGTIAAGEPIHVFEQERESIAIPVSKVPSQGNLFALRVTGESMVEENINDGDVILVKQQSVADNGQKIVALVDGDQATVKKFYKEHGQVRLQPANKSMEPIIVKKDRDIVIRGIVLDVVHNTSVAAPPTESKIEPLVAKQKSGLPEPYYEKPGFKLYHSNCLDILAQLPENSIDMIFADPPYNLSNGGFTVHAGRMVNVNKGSWDKSRGFKDDYNFHYKWLEACKRVLKPHGTLWVSGTYHSIYQCGHALQALGYHILNDIAWFKPNASPNLSCRYFTASHETLIWARKEKGAKHIFNYNLMKSGRWPEDTLKKAGSQMRSVWAIGTPKAVEKRFGKHPTQKPEDLLKRIVLASTNKGDLVIDPFTGSSTTGLAAHIYGRKFIGIDTERKFLDLSIKRFEELIYERKR